MKHFIYRHPRRLQEDYANFYIFVCPLREERDKWGSHDFWIKNGQSVNKRVFFCIGARPHVDKPGGIHWYDTEITWDIADAKEDKYMRLICPDCFEYVINSSELNLLITIGRMGGTDGVSELMNQWGSVDLSEYRSEIG